MLGTTIQGRRAAQRGAFDDASVIAEPRAEEHVGVGEEALLERDDDELRADVLGVGQVERGVDLVEDVHRRWFELQQRHDQRQRDE